MLGWIALASCATAPSSPGAKPSEAALDAKVPALLAKYRVASVGVALIEQGRVVLERGYGEQSAGVAATSATLFNLASLTKPISAEVLLRLVAEGQLSLDEPMSSYWVDPDIAADARHQQLTLRIALSHQTGLPNWRGRSPDGKLAFEFAPGSAYAYSGEGYDYAARFAERKLGRSFEDLAEMQVFGPLRMTSTSYSWREWMQGRLAVPLDADGRWGNPQVQGAGDWNAGNNLITTAGDYARLVASVMGRVATWNAGAQRFQGFESKEVIGQDFACFFTVEDVALGKPQYEILVAARDGHFEDEGWRLRKDSSRHAHDGRRRSDRPGQCPDREAVRLSPRGTAWAADRDPGSRGQRTADEFANCTSNARGVMRNTDEWHCAFSVQPTNKPSDDALSQERALSGPALLVGFARQPQLE